MKGIIIFEDFKKHVNCKEILDGYYNCVISDYPEATFSGVINRVTGARCNKDDTYDFETGALIALMKLCGVEKVVRAFNEAFPKETHNTYITKFERELNSLKKDFDKVRDLKDFYKKNYEDVKEHYGKLGDRNKYLIEDINKKLEYIKEKDEEIEKLKLDCEKLQHGYIDTDMIFCGGRQNGKQYTALVGLFKKIDQKKVDEAYKEAYNTTLPVWQKEVLRQAYEIRKESKENTELPRTLDINGVKYRKTLQIKDYGEQISKLTVDSLIEENRAFTRKCVDEWLYKIPTKREEMWGKIFALHKESDVIIEVKKEDVNTFLHEIEDKFPEITWGSGVKIFETKYTIKDVYFELKSHDVIYFRLSRATKLTYTSDPHIYRYRDLEHISYLPPMRWDLFKKGRLAVKVNYDNYKEFYEACEKELGKIPSCMFTGDFTVSICKKDGYFEIFTIEDQKKTGRKIVDWESVKPVGTPIKMEDPYDTWKW